MASAVLWVVQSNLGSSKDINAIQEACEELGLPCMPVIAIPFSDELPDVPNDRPVVFYGSSNFVTNVYRSGRWQPGAFFNESMFQFSEAFKHYGTKCLNSDATFTTMGALAKESFPNEKQLFIRPVGDLKEFAGNTFSFGEYQEWCTSLSAGDLSITLETPIVAATPKQIDHEWRLFIVNKRVISGSHYRSLGVLEVSEHIPETVVRFGEELARIWSPDIVYVMDIAESGGRFSLIEINGFNSSGFYASDIKKIVGAISDAVGSNYAIKGTSV
jgi:hypothetical protein